MNQLAKVASALQKQTAHTATQPVRTATAQSSEAAKRAALSYNAGIVKVDKSCRSLFVPKVAKEVFRGIVPVWNIYFLNNSQHRYRISYDISYRKAGKTYFGSYNENLTHESSATIRPGVFLRLPAMKGARDIKEITRVHVFRCAK